MSYAAHGGHWHVELVKLLLDQPNIDMNPEDDESRKVISYPALVQHERATSCQNVVGRPE
jgi:hypothetical protein